jgi:hypothetical protein
MILLILSEVFTGKKLKDLSPYKQEVRKNFRLEINK